MQKYDETLEYKRRMSRNVVEIFGPVYASRLMLGAATDWAIR